VVEEPRGEVLRRLIRALGQYSSSVMMVLRDDFDLDESGRALLARLQPHLVERNRRSSWPGTTLLREEATVFRFALNEAVLNILSDASDGLYDWQQPTLPEDLALVRDDGTAILGSICHEQDAYLEVTDEEYGSLTGSVPEIARIVRLQEEDDSPTDVTF
jgi:hypothetical protein